MRKAIYLIISVMSIGIIACKDEENITPAVNKNVPPASPNIKYSNIDKISVFGATNQTNIQYFDADNDGTNDFSYTYIKSNNDVSIAINALNENELHVGFNNSIPQSISYLIYDYQAGDTINSTVKYWQKYGFIYFRDDHLGMNQDLYLAIKLQVNGKSCYGWLRIKYNIITGGGFAATINIIDAAYEQTEGYAIEAGRKS
ncbi:MAG: hypothetical protein U0U67_15450 [Chitinophagales bacterium]